jgi:hypothetical protein
MSPKSIPSTEGKKRKEGRKRKIHTSDMNSALCNLA